VIGALVVQGDPAPTRARLCETVGEHWEQPDTGAIVKLADSASDETKLTWRSELLVVRGGMLITIDAVDGAFACGAFACCVRGTATDDPPHAASMKADNVNTVDTRRRTNLLIIVNLREFLIARPARSS
jgi:hypothetical protein